MCMCVSVCPVLTLLIVHFCGSPILRIKVHVPEVLLMFLENSS